MEIAQLDVDDTTAMGEAFAMYQAVHAADAPDTPPPLWEEFVAELGAPHPEHRFESLIAQVHGRTVGLAMLLLPQIDNRHLAMALPRVHPGHRRHGVGRALLERCYQRIDADGRRTVLSRATRPVPGGPPRDDAGVRFLEAMGFTAALELLGRRIDLGAIDEASEQRLYEECQLHATEYECHTWTGMVPDALAAGIAYLVNRLSTDAPRGEMALEETTLDTERLHADVRHTLDGHSHLVWAAARHRSTGEVAAMTRIDVRPDGDHGAVWLTIADPTHRGHRLGTVVKIESHRLARRLFPGIRHVYTGNADSNAQMAAINERLGFVAYELNINYQLTR